MLAGLKPTVTPGGCPDAVSAMADANPPEAVLLSTTLPIAPTGTVSAPFAVSAKLGDVTVSVSAATERSEVAPAFPAGLVPVSVMA